MVCRTGYKSLQSRHSSNTPQYCHRLRVITPTEELRGNSKGSERCAGVFQFMQLSFTWFSLVLVYIVSIVLMKNSVRRKMYPHLLFKLSSFVLFTHSFFPLSSTSQPQTSDFLLLLFLTLSLSHCRWQRHRNSLFRFDFIIYNGGRCISKCLSKSWQVKPV